MSKDYKEPPILHVHEGDGKFYVMEVKIACKARSKHETLDEALAAMEKMKEKPEE